MAFTYNTRRNKTYYLHSGPKRGGGTQHFFSTSPEGPLADAIPEGFEVYVDIGPPAPLGVLVRKFCPHLGKESIYELY